MNDDTVMLRRYVEDASEEAFTALVRKHLDLVYSAALRRTGGDPHRAAEVAQEVFTALAHQARTLVHHPVLSAWLHATTRNVASNARIAKQRRERRQHIAMELETAQMSEATPEWDRLRPVLDAAIDELPGRDRLSVVMRFLERRPFREIGAAMRISEDAARMRTERALEKLREGLVRRGITSTAEALATVVAAHATVSAPVGLAASIAAESLATSVAGGTVVSTIVIAGKLVATAAISALVAFGAGSLMAKNRVLTSTPALASAQPGAFSALAAENRRLDGELQRLNAEMESLKTANARLVAERAKRASTTPGRAGRIVGAPLQRYEIQEGVLNNFRQLAAAQDQYKLENGKWPASLNDIIGATNYVHRITPVDGEDYADLLLGGRTFRLTTKSGVTIAYANDEPADTSQPEFRIDYPPAVTRARELEKKLADAKQTATEAYRLANRGRNPPNDDALIAFFATPEEGADFVEYLEAKKSLPDN